MNETEELVRSVVSEVLAVDRSKVDALSADEEHFTEVLGANSIDSLEILITLEERLNLQFNDEELNPDALRTIRGLVERLDALRATAAPQQAPAEAQA